MTIEITGDDIKNGKRVSCRECPIALALRREIGASFVSVGMEEIECSGSEFGSLRWMTPAPARKFIDRFDLGRPVKPFVLELE